MLAGKDVEELESTVYTLKIKDNLGGVHRLRLLGLEKITSNPGRVDVGAAYDVFPYVENGVLDRPNAEVGILIGRDHVNLLPTGGDGMDCQDNLRVMRTRIGTGYVLGGSHPQIRCKPVVRSSVTPKLRSAKFLTTVINGKKMNYFKRVGYPEFLEAEELATDIPRCFERCVGCKRCSYQSQEMSRQEHDE